MKKYGYYHRSDVVTCPYTKIAIKYWLKSDHCFCPYLPLICVIHYSPSGFATLLLAWQEIPGSVRAFSPL